VGTLMGLWDLLIQGNNDIRITRRSAPPTQPPITNHFLFEPPPSRHKRS